MVKHILGMAIYEIIVIYAIIFGGDHFYPELDPAWRFERANINMFVYPGRLYDWDNSPLYVLKVDTVGPSRHLTNVFNVFVVMQIFNMINARKINDEKNIFAGLFSNPMFLVVWLLIVICQVIIIEFGSKAIKCAIGGLPWEHWVIAIVMGFISWVWSFILKFVPDTFCP